MPTKGALEFQKFKDGKLLTRKQALLAQCYECNGYESEDCLGVSCPLYSWSPYNKKAKLDRLNKVKPYPKGMIEANLRRRATGKATVLSNSNSNSNSNSKISLP